MNLELATRIALSLDFVGKVKCVFARNHIHGKIFNSVKFLLLDVWAHPNSTVNCFPKFMKFLRHDVVVFIAVKIHTRH